MPDHSQVHHHHAHGHHHHSADNIGWAFVLNFTFSLLELGVGLWIGSLAILANAVHDIGDSVSLSLAWYLEKVSGRKSDTQFNFGYRRFSLFSSLISAVIICAGAVYVLIESIEEVGKPRAAHGWEMLTMAGLGLLINISAAYKLSRGTTQNEKVLSWHFISDTFSWAAVLIGAVVILVSGQTWVDPVLGILLSMFVIWNIGKHLKETFYLLLQGRPKSFDETSFISEVLKIPGVKNVHKISVWSLDGMNNVLSCCIHVESLTDSELVEKQKLAVRALAEKQNAIRVMVETTQINLACEVPTSEASHFGSHDHDHDHESKD